MSGITGVIRPGGIVSNAEPERMVRLLAARGPDRQTVSCHGPAGFGHALLATTPEALVGTQPWTHPESGCVVVSDSRLDNRPQLLRELGIERPADTVGDGELLHGAWQRWREGCADRLRGDFAFAIWHPGEGELYLARDPMGVRPLLFHHDPGRLFVFASSAEGVLAQGDVPTSFNEARIADALIGETEGIDNVCTFFSAVQRLPPAHWLRLRDGHVTEQRYWQPIGADRPDGLPRTEQEWIEAQRERLDTAVRQRLRSHRPVGSMLSGGLDSSAVVALASKACSESGQPPFPVFSATNSLDPECPETRAIHAVASGAACAPTNVDLPDFQRTRTRAHRLWEEAGEPFDGTFSILASLYEAAAARGVPSVMDGLPADNLYPVGRRAGFLFDQGRWRQAWQAAVAQWDVPWVRFPRLNAMRVMAGCMAPAGVHEWRDRRAAESEYRRLLRNSLISHEFARRTNLRQRYHRYRRTIGGSHQWHESGEALSPLAAPYITAAIERYNRLASLYGIEPRPPYADRDLIEFQAWMPLELRIRDGSMKWVLRKAMTGLLPHDVIWRRDKQHIGWHFTWELLQQAHAAGLTPTGPAEHTWFDLPRMARAQGDLHAGAAAGLPAALILLSWSRNPDRQASTHSG